MNLPTSLILIAVSSVISGQLCLKLGMSKIGKIDKSNSQKAGRLMLNVLSEPKVIWGLFFYISSSVLWVYILSLTDLSYAFPFLSIAYVGVPTMASIILKEKIPLQRWLGIFLVVVGVLLVASTN